VPKPMILKAWTEMSQGFLYDGPPKREDFEAVLFVNHCELRKTNGDPYLLRNHSCVFLTADTKKEIKEKVRDYMLRDDVRLLAKGVESNDFDTLPKREQSPDRGIIDGTADIYEAKEEVGA
jgi:hypothetical protein